MGQSSNDTFPTAMHIATLVEVGDRMLPRLGHLSDAVWANAVQWVDVIKIGRTHLQDATPLTVGQEWSGWATQLRDAQSRLEQATEACHQGGAHAEQLLFGRGTGDGDHPSVHQDGQRHQESTGDAAGAVHHCRARPQAVRVGCGGAQPPRGPSPADGPPAGRSGDGPRHQPPNAAPRRSPPPRRADTGPPTTDTAHAYDHTHDSTPAAARSERTPSRIRTTRGRASPQSRQRPTTVRADNPTAARSTSNCCALTAIKSIKNRPFTHRRHRAFQTITRPGRGGWYGEHLPHQRAARQPCRHRPLAPCPP
jgi:hypothetical protein